MWIRCVFLNIVFIFIFLFVFLWYIFVHTCIIYSSLWTIWIIGTVNKLHPARKCCASEPSFLVLSRTHIPFSPPPEASRGLASSQNTCNIFKIYAVCVLLYIYIYIYIYIHIYIINIHSTHTHTHKYYVTKTFTLNAINRKLIIAQHYCLCIWITGCETTLIY